MVKVESFSFDNKQKFDLALSIRKEVFVKEQCVDERLEFDGLDPVATHYLAFYNETTVGTARWRNTEKGIKLERFAVLAPYRSKKIGIALLEAVLKDVKVFNETIYLNSQTLAIGFYLKYGFVKSGKPFFEAGIEHIKMVLK